LKKVIYFFCIFSCFISLQNVTAQYFSPEYGEVFVQNEISIVKIEIDPDSLAFMLLEENLFSDHEYPATFIFQNSLVSDTLYNVGFRLRGNTSRLAAKKSFKVSINSFEPRRWRGLEKVNLNGNHNDVSMLRAKLCSDMYRELGLPAARLAYTKLYINNEYRGIYLNTEHIDEEFANKYFDQQGDGNLYKCLYPADLNYLGTNSSNYQLEVFGRRPYELKTNLWQDNYSDLAQFITALHNANETGLECNIQEEFDLHSFVKYLALEILQGHWDAYVYNKNNFYLYHNETTDQICWIPYDMDNTLGIDWVGQDWTARNIYNFPPSGEDRLLYDVIMENPYWRGQFSKAINDCINLFFNDAWLNEKVNQYHDLISDEISSDPYYPLDYGFTSDDFLQAPFSTWGGHVSFSLSDYFNQRAQSALDQLQAFDSIEPVFAITDNGPQPNIPIVRCFYEGNITPILQYKIDDGSTMQTTMGDDGNFPDDVANDNVYHGFINTDGGNKISYQILVGSSLYPCWGENVIWLTESSVPLQINEVMSLNSSTIADSEGEYDDWVELYNPGPTNVNMSNMFMTDEFGNWDKWPLPSIITPVNSFRLFWADDQPEQGNDHMNFRLSDNGETIWLVRYEQGAPRIVDGAAFAAIPVDFSYGRITESSNDYIEFSTPTPLAANGVVSVQEKSLSEITVYPNPATLYLNFSKSAQNIQLLNMQGQVLVRRMNDKQLDVSSLPTGIYMLQLDGAVFKICVER
jgi:spore coat protein H